MRKRIVRVSPVQAGKVSAVLYAVISIPVALIMVAASMLGHSGSSMLFAVLIPIVYLVFGFIFTVIGAWLYNLVAGWTGGLEFDSEEQAQA